MKMIQQKNIIGSVKILKNFINYKTWISYVLSHEFWKSSLLMFAKFFF